MRRLLARTWSVCKRTIPASGVYRRSLCLIAFLITRSVSVQAQTMYLASDLGIHRVDLASTSGFTPELVLSASNIYSLAVADASGGTCTSVLWTQNQQNGARHLFTSGSQLDFQNPQLVSTAALPISAADSEYAYSIEHPFPYDTFRIIGTRITDGSSSTIISTSSDFGTNSITSVAANSGYLYWTTVHSIPCDPEGVPCVLNPEGVFRKRVSGGPTETIDSGLANDIDCGHGYYAVAPGGDSLSYYRRCQIACCEASLTFDCGDGGCAQQVGTCNGPSGFIVDGLHASPITFPSLCGISSPRAWLDDRHGHLYWLHGAYPNLMRLDITTGVSSPVPLPFTVRSIGIAHGTIDPSITFDLYVSHVEVSQAVPLQTDPMVIGKPLFVRGYVGFDGALPPGHPGWEGVLHLLDSGAQPIREPLPTYHGRRRTKHYPRYSLTSSANESETLNFLVKDLTPTEWAQLAFVTVEVNPCDMRDQQYDPVVESVKSNNRFEPPIPIVTECHQPVRIGYYRAGIPTLFSGTVYPSTTAIRPGIGDYLYRSMYPIPHYTPGSLTYESLDTIALPYLPAVQALSADLRKEIYLNAAYHLVSLVQWLGGAMPPPIVAVWFDHTLFPGGLKRNDVDFWGGGADPLSARLICAHETGHCATLTPNDGALTNDPEHPVPIPHPIGYGYDVYSNDPRHIITQRRYALMSWGAARSPDETQWVTPDEYDQLLNWQPLLCGGAVAATPPNPEDHLLVMGRYLPDGQDEVILDQIWQWSGHAVTPNAVAGSLRLIAASPATTKTYELAFSPSCSPLPPTSECAFVLEIPATVAGYPIANVAIQSVGSDTVLAQRSRSSHRPTVEILTPEPGTTLEHGDQVLWSGADKDGDALTYSVFYSFDHGATWRPWIAHTQGTTALVDQTQLPGSSPSDGQIRVFANDGFNTSVVTQVALTFNTRKAPAVSIITPLEGAIILKGVPETAEASVIDSEDGSLSNEQIVWTSSRDGLLGNGDVVSLRALSTGEHILTLTATDSDGMISQGTVELEVRNRSNDCIPVLPWSDCDHNAIRDDCEAENGTMTDCNNNRYPDSCDIGDERSTDVDHNGIPDECQTDLIHGACCLVDALHGASVCADATVREQCQEISATFFESQACASVTCVPASQPRGACCAASQSGPHCRENVSQGECAEILDTWHQGETCADIACRTDAVPTVSVWGLIVLVLFILIMGKVAFGSRGAPRRI